MIENQTIKQCGDCVSTVYRASVGGTIKDSSGYIFYSSGNGWGYKTTE